MEKEKTVEKGKSFAEKFCEVLREIEPVKKNAQNQHFKNKYTDINGLLEAVKTILEKKNLYLKQPIITEMGANILETIIHDKDGNCEVSRIKLPDLQDPQKVGSCITYYRRYSLQSMLGMETIDDDGNVASGKEVVSGKEVESPWKTCPICGKEHNGPRQRCAECFAKNLT